MENSDKIGLFIDGDNIDESYTDCISEACKAFGEVYEAHCFSDFVQRKQRWETAYRKYGIELHYIPGSEKRRGKPDPNTSDIAMALYIAEKLYERPEIDVYIIVANDKDYIPLAKMIREKFRKKAIMFYNEENDSAVTSYDATVLLRKDCDSETLPLKTEAVKEVEPVKAITVAEDNQNYATLVKLMYCIEEQFEKQGDVLLAEFGPVLKPAGVVYGKYLGKFLSQMFDKYSILKEHYRLVLGDSQDRIERV